jgi:alpha-amylase/alpha-mannosidase (GH57 family)
MSEAQHKQLCMHGHFYQPPREDPFTHHIPDEPGASPYRNFNEKITMECYRANAAIGNFEEISFDMGPTLALWLARYAPDVYLRIIESDRLYRLRYGVGNAIAHAYNHTILPLATSRDKRTQIAWGLIDFRHRFGRLPQGMWLAETAIDMESLEIMAEMGIEFTVLAPWQAAQSIDPTEPYWVPLSGGRRIAVFFYNGPISGEVSFVDHVTNNADTFASATLPGQVNWDKANRNEDQLVLIATDGELYGHHKTFRDRFLSHLVHHSAPAAGFEVTTLGRYLRDHPPQHEVSIYAPSAWSCAHGVARWDSGCSCTEGDSFSWKPALRKALRTLEERIDILFEKHGSLALVDPWKARDQFIAWRNGWLSAEAFWAEHGHRGYKPSKESLAVRTWHLLEAEYYMQASFTSCGWFFEDLDRIEPRNDINYARCAISHMWQALHVDLQTSFIKELAASRSWRTGITGDEIYRQLPPVPTPGMLPKSVRPVRKEPAA